MTAIAVSCFAAERWSPDREPRAVQVGSAFQIRDSEIQHFGTAAGGDLIRQRVRLIPGSYTATSTIRSVFCHTVLLQIKENALIGRLNRLFRTRQASALHIIYDSRDIDTPWGLVRMK